MKNLLQDIKSHIGRKNFILLIFFKFLEDVFLLSTAGILAWLIDGVFLQQFHNEEGAVSKGVLLLLVCLCLRYSANYFTGKYLNSLSFNLRLFYRQRLNHSLLQQQKQHKNIFSNLCLENVDALDEFFQKVIPLVITAIIRLPLFLTVVFYLDWISGLVFLITFPIVPFILYLLGKVTQNASQQEWEKQSAVNYAFYEMLRGMVTLKIFGCCEAELKKLKQLSKDFAASSLKVLRTAFLSSFVSELITTLSIAMAAVFIGLRILDDKLSFLVGFYILLLAPEFYLPLRLAGSAFHITMNTNTAFTEIRDNFDSNNFKVKENNFKELPKNLGIEIHQLSFAYPNCETNCLEKLSLYIPAGSFTVLRGSSGVGKSTVLQLIAGMYLVERDTIFIGDFDAQQLTSKEFSSLVGYVPQEPHVFNLTLKENLTLGCAYTDEECINVLKAASLEVWYKSLPMGLNTVLGNDGIRLSNGQRHRLGLSRILLRQTPIVLLDELTAGLEEDEERQLLQILRRELRGKTIVMASHRQQVINMADKVIEIGGGELCR